MERGGQQPLGEDVERLPVGVWDERVQHRPTQPRRRRSNQREPLVERAIGWSRRTVCRPLLLPGAPCPARRSRDGRSRPNGCRAHGRFVVLPKRICHHGHRRHRRPHRPARRPCPPQLGPDGARRRQRVGRRVRLLREFGARLRQRRSLGGPRADHGPAIPRRPPSSGKRPRARGGWRLVQRRQRLGAPSVHQLVLAFVRQQHLHLRSQRMDRGRAQLGSADGWRKPRANGRRPVRTRGCGGSGEPFSIKFAGREGLALLASRLHERLHVLRHGD